MAHDSDVPANYHEKLCTPLTRRPMLAGLPYEITLGVFFCGVQFINFDIYEGLLFLPVMWWVLRRLIEHDEWAIGMALNYAIRRVRGDTRLDP